MSPQQREVYDRLRRDPPPKGDGTIDSLAYWYGRESPDVAPPPWAKIEASLARAAWLAGRDVAKGETR